VEKQAKAVGSVRGFYIEYSTIENEIHVSCECGNRNSSDQNIDEEKEALSL